MRDFHHGLLGGLKAGFGAVLGGALVGGATAGALNTAFNGGNFLVNVFSGAKDETAKDETGSNLYY
jgi:hypothetical protein